MTATETRSTRPTQVIQADIAVTRLAIEVCDTVVKAVLDARVRLLHSGFPATHSLCVALDNDAAPWAGEAAHQRTALLDLLGELGPDDSTP